MFDIFQSFYQLPIYLNYRYLFIVSREGRMDTFNGTPLGFCNSLPHLVRTLIKILYGNDKLNQAKCYVDELLVRTLKELINALLLKFKKDDSRGKWRRFITLLRWKSVEGKRDVLRHTQHLR